MNIENCETGRDHEITDVFVNAHDRLVVVSNGKPIFTLTPTQALELSQSMVDAITDYNSMLEENLLKHSLLQVSP